MTSRLGNRFWREAGVLLGGLAIVVLLAGCGGSAGADPELSLELRDGVVGQCGAEGYGQDMCGCVVEELELRFDGDALQRVAAQIAAPEQEPPPEASEILLRCSERLGSAAAPGSSTSVAPRTLPPASTGSRYPSADAACADEVQRLLVVDGVDRTDETFIGYPEAVCAVSTNPTWCVETALTTSTELAGDGVSRELLRDNFLAACVGR